MGLFDEVLSGLESQSGQHAALFEEVAGLVKESGGVSGLAQQFQQKGLDGIMSGWIGSGGNPPISADQIIQVIGQDRVTAIAAKVGLSEQQVADGIAKILPLVISHLTPNGTAQDQSVGELDGALGLLKSKLFG